MTARTLAQVLLVFAVVGVLAGMAFPFFVQAKTYGSGLTAARVKGAILQYRRSTKKWPKTAAEIRPYIQRQRYSETALIERETVSADNSHADYRIRVSNGARQETLRTRLTAPG